MTRIGINGMGRMGRLLMRCVIDDPNLDLVVVNEPSKALDTLAILLEFDTVQGRWSRHCVAAEGGIRVDDKLIPMTQERELSNLDWSPFNVDVVLECSGQHRTQQSVAAHLLAGAKRVVVSAPVRGGPPNIVMGVNDHVVDFENEPIVSAASCTTNCLAPVVRVLHDSVGIEHGLVTTIHAPTNTQVVCDGAHADPRRARNSQMNLIPTSTNSATAVGLIIPELAGKLDSVAVRAPVHNASLTDCVFYTSKNTQVEEVNEIFRAASQSEKLRGILGYETRPLVSSDYAQDSRSAVVDADCTRVTNNRLVKIMAWYDNEWGYVNRMFELTHRVAQHLK